MTTNVKTVIRSANGSAAITPVADPISGLWDTILPVIVASGASGAGQVNVGDKVAVYNQGSPIGPTRVLDAAGHRLATIGAGAGFTFIAQADLNWYRLTAAESPAVLDIVANGSSTVTVSALGPGNATATIKGWLAVMLSDGTIGNIPYWQ
jgi:hypothetical protein